MACKRCLCVMYGHTPEENHKPGYCADGAPRRPILNPVNNIETPDRSPIKEIPWPQPQGIFTNGKCFHPLAFLQTIRTLYHQLVEEKVEPSNLDLELQAFAVLYARQMVPGANGANYFKLPDIKIDPLGSSLIVEMNGERHLRVDCLQDDAESP